MADFSTLIASIEATIKQNGVQAITGQILQDELLLMVSAINQLKQDTLEGYAFYGEPLPNGATRVVTQNTFFLAGAGSYTINGDAVTITDSGISVIVYDCVNDEITTYQLFAYDANPISGSANAVTSGGVKSALDTKADKNGASPDLFAGFAGNLVDTRSAGTRQGPFAFRQSGGDGVNYMRKILGRTEAFNQLGRILAPSGTYGGITLVANADGSFSVSGTAEETCNFDFYDSRSDGSLISGHKYYISCGLSGGSAETYCVFDRGSIGYISDGRGVILTGTENVFVPAFRVSEGVSVDFNVYPQLIDLTLEGLGLTTADQFRALHPLGYYSPASKLINNAATGLETTGFNQWDEEWESGVYLQASGEPGYGPSRLRGKNYIPVFGGVAYYAKSPVQLVILSYDANKNYLGETTVRTATNEEFTPEAGVAFIRFYTGENLTTYNHDICINRSDASRNGIYEPYWKREIVLGITGVTGIPEGGTEADRVTIFPDGMAGVGTAQDMFYEENGVAKAKKVMGSVGLGDLSWDYNSTYGIMYTTQSGLKGGQQNAICARYDNPVNYSLATMVDKTMTTRPAIQSNNIIIKDSAYSDPDTFKTAMDGVYLDYELAAPVVYTSLRNADGTPFVFPKMTEVDNLGTERRLPEDTADNPQAPFECDSNYSISTANLVRKLSE